jgi:nucleotide-binding universal stress UspA family protein
MFKHILVPLDGSHLAEAAVPVAAYLARTLKAPVTLLHVIEQDAPAEIHRDRHLTNSDQANAYLAKIASRKVVSSIKLDWHVHTAPVSDVTRSIVDHSADEFQPDLIVLTSHGNSGTHDLVFGTIAQQVATASGTPVLLIKPSSKKESFKINRILIPLDNESVHDQALPISEELAVKFHAELSLICVIPTLGTLYGAEAATGQMMPTATTAYLEIAEEIAQEHFQSHLDEFQKLKIAATAEIARGDPAAVITRTAEEKKVDLIIFASHGRAGLDAFWNRSIAAAVARRTETPILLIPLSD